METDHIHSSNHHNHAAAEHASLGEGSDNSPASVTESPPKGGAVIIMAGVVGVALAAVYAFGIARRHDTSAALLADAKAVAESAPLVEVATVKRSDIRQFLALPGEARPLNQSTVYARTSGYVAKWLVDIGDHVKQGQSLATIDTPELDDQLNAARANLTQSKSEANLAQSAADFAKVTFDRWESAAPDGVVSTQERDEKKAQLQNSLAHVEAAQAHIAVSDAEVHRLETLISFKKVTAPFDGVITERRIDIGDLVTAGSTTSTTPMFTIARIDRLRVFVSVPQNAVSQIRPGITATAQTQENAGLHFTGVVDRTSQSVDPLSRTMKVEVLVDNPDELLKPGSYLQVSFQTDRTQPPLEIPASAITFRSEGPMVAVVSAQNRVSFRHVQIERDDGDHIEIGSGLHDGDRVAMNISTDITEGSVVEPHVPQSEGRTDAKTNATPTIVPSAALVAEHLRASSSPQ